MPVIRVLVVDDSALVRKTVRELIEVDPDLRVVGVAVDGKQALKRVSELRPDVVTLDLHMPVMDGMSCLVPLVRDHRQRVVVLSTLTRENSFPTFKALALGAIDFVTKPGAGSYLGTLDKLGFELRSKIRLAARVSEAQVGQVKKTTNNDRSFQNLSPPESKRVSIPSPPLSLRAVVGVGSSTGGTAVLEKLFRGLPATFPGAVVVVQHLPLGFSSHFARYLESVSSMKVKIPEDMELIQPATAYVAPAGAHLLVQRRGSELVLRSDLVAPARRGFRPSIDALFYSLATAERHRTIGILLSGMGEDGAYGLKAIRKLGGRTVVQDQSSSIVYGMAARAVEIGAVETIAPADSLTGTIMGAVVPKWIPSEAS